jgi:DNA-binding GntR family transcriptional regulator
MTEAAQPGAAATSIHLAGRQDQAPVRVKSVHMQVRDQLTRDIVSGVLAPGQRLTQADLASRFGVSVAPIREALRELNNEGLVELDPFTGVTVHRPTLESLENVYEVRLALEPLTIPHERVKLPDDVVGDAAGLIEVMDRNLDRASWTAANKEFHRLLRSHCTNALVLELLHRLENLFDVYVSLSMINRADANDEHRELLEAYRRGRRKEILALTRNHIRGTFDACRVVLTDPANLSAEPQQRAANRP